MSSKKITIHCKYCSVKMQVFQCYKDRKYCSQECKRTDYKIRFKGKSNPNYGMKWSEEMKNQQSRTITEKYESDPEYRYSVGKSNRGKKFSNELIEKMHDHRTPESYGVKNYTPELRAKIGKRSKEKFTPEYKINIRKKFEELGYWVPLSEKSRFEIYFKEADWNRRMWDLVNTPLLETLGIFNSRTNPKGVVRDHMFSRRSGFEQGVFPIILRHPANCQIITHKNNIQKKTSRYRDRDDITLDKLFHLIEKYESDWHEHSDALDAIKRYHVGERWS